MYLMTSFNFFDSISVLSVLMTVRVLYQHKNVFIYFDTNLNILLLKLNYK